MSRRAQLEELGGLLRDHLISQAEHDETKQRILSSFGRTSDGSSTAANGDALNALNAGLQDISRALVFLGAARNDRCDLPDDRCDLDSMPSVSIEVVWPHALSQLQFSVAIHAQKPPGRLW